VLSDYWRRDSEWPGERRILASPHVYERNAIPNPTNPAGPMITRRRIKHEMAVNRKFNTRSKMLSVAATYPNPENLALGVRDVRLV
jgi:hypothetical protein